MSAEGAAFWIWSSTRYAAPGVSARLLELQDRYGLDVNIVLWCLWAGERYAEAPELVLRKAIDLCNPWAARVTSPLREARRALKSPPKGAEDAAAELRTAITANELEAERIEQHMLAALAVDQLSPAPTDGAASRARRNLSRYAALAGAVKREGFSARLLEAIADLIVPYPDDTQTAAAR